jgi:hypothetical protein
VRGVLDFKISFKVSSWFIEKFGVSGKDLM